ncbi:MAG: hypothetical protein RBR87_09355 [Bacteroidales bacterium]|jgi:hypothetical protein|nr:hypothetical protein [Bacteroidales bacterium]
MKKFTFLVAALFASIGMLLAQAPTTHFMSKEIPEKSDKEFQFLAFFINQGVASNFYPTSEFLRGQVVGRLFGQNGSMTSDTSRALYIEQRIVPFFIYQPNLFNGKAILRASFEIDWTWGDASYGTGGNLGGAISADQVNLQTQNIELELLPWDRWAINLGMQRMFDSPYNAYRTLFDKMTNTGYRLGYFGTDAVGVTVRHDRDFGKYKAGFYKFYENDIFQDDDVNMFELMAERSVSPLWNVGVSFNYVRDRSAGKGGISILGQGLNSLLNDYMGTFKFKFGTDPYKADIFWTGAFFSRNADMMADRWSLTGFFNYNYGTVDVKRNGIFEKGADLGGFGANLKTIYRYGQTPDDHLKLDLVYTTGDEDGLADKKYSGVMTANTWAAPGAIFISSGTYILMPHGNVVNRYTPAIADLSNMGYGMSFASATASKGVIPYKLIAKLGGGFAMSNAEPQAGGKTIGTETNVSLVYNVGTYMSIEWHAAHMWLGDFYDSADDRYGAPINGGVYGVRPVNPWTSFLVVKWLMF